MKGKTSKQILTLLCVVCALALSLGVWIQTRAEKAREILNPDLKQVTFSDWGFKDDTYQRSPEGDIIVGREYTDTLAGKVFSGDVIFHDGEYEDATAMMYIGGSGVWSGMVLASDEATQTLKLTVGGETYTLKADVAGLTTFFDKPFNLKLSYEVVDNALQLGVWFENKLYNNEYITVTKGNNGEGTYEYYLTGELEIFATGWASLTIASDTPKVLNPELDQITFSNWGFKDDTYQRSPEGDIIVGREYTDTLAGKVFSGDVIFHDGEYEDATAMMYIGGSSVWSGMVLASDEATQTLKLTVGGDTYTFSSHVAGVTLFDNKFNLKISYEVVDNALQLGVWFNDKLYDNEYITVTKGNNGEGTYEYYLTGELEIFATGWASLTIASDGPKVLNPDLEKVTFSDWGFEDGTYQRSAEGEVIVGRQYTDTLAGKVFSGNVIFHDGEYEDVSAMMYIGGAGVWEGMILASDETNQTLVLTVGGETYTFYSNVARVTSFFDNEFNLKLSYEVINNALRLGVWFNDKLYDNEYITVNKGNNGEGTYEYYLTGELEIFATGWASLTIDSDQVEVLDPTLEQVTFSNWGLEDKTHTNTSDVVPYDAYKDSLKGKVFSGYVTFASDEADGEAYLLIGKGANVDLWSGLCLRTDGNTGNLILAVGGATYTITPEDVGDVTLVNNPFNLKLSYQTIDSDKDGAEDALKLGVWVNNTLYKNEYIVITTYDYVNGDSSVTPGRYEDYLMGPLGIHATGTSSLTVRSDKLKALDSSLEQISFSHYGWEDGTYSGTSDIVVEREYKESLGNKVISVDVIFTPGQDGNQAYMCIGNGAKKDIWSGLCLQTDGDSGNLLLHVGGQTYTLEPLYAGGVRLVNNKFNLKLSYEVVDTDEDEAVDALQLGVWIDNKLYKNEYIMISNYVYTDSNGDTNGTYEDYLTGGIGIHAPGNSSISIDSDIPEQLPDLGHLTFSDWGWNDGTYSGTDDIIVERDYIESLKDKIFCGDVTFSKSFASIYIGGGEKGIWSGLYLTSGQVDGSLQFGFGGKQYTINPATAIGVDSLTDKPFNLKISYQVENKQLKLGLWFNDKLYNNEYFYATDYEHYLTGGLGIHAPKGLNGSGMVTIASEKVNIDFTEVLNPDLEVITFRDFGIENGRYKYNKKPAIVAQGSFDGTLEGKVFSGDVTFSEQAVHLLIGGEPNEECGTYLGSGQYGYSKSSLVLRIGGYEPIEIKPALAGGVKLVGETFNLKLSYEVIDVNNDGQKDTLKFGIWFNDMLYNNEYLYVSTYGNYVYDGKEYTGTYKNLLAPRLGIYTESKGSSMKVASVGTEVLSSTLKQITFSDFGIIDDIYTYVGDLAVSGTYADTLVNKVICGDVTFSSKPATLYVGGEPDVKNGMSITSTANGNLSVKLGDNEYMLTSDIAGAKLVGKAFNLKLSYQVVDDDGDGKDDTLQLGVWINDKLYNNEYFTVSSYGVNRTYTDYLTGRLAVYPTTEGASIKLVSDKPKVMEPSLEKITFADFSISDGTYTVKHGMYKGSLNGKYFSGNVTFSNVRSDIWIGGHNDFWEGMGLISGYKGDEINLHLLAGGRDYTFTPDIAGTTLVGANFNLKLSYQVVDCDGDGKEDALQLGVWFNNKLYNNQYIYITNYERYLGGCLGIYTEGEGAYVTVASDLAVDNPALGSRRAPSPNTGDSENIVLYISLGVLALAAMALSVKKKRLE